jgi:hypothetical protein
MHARGVFAVDCAGMRISQEASGVRYLWATRAIGGKASCRRALGAMLEDEPDLFEQIGNLLGQLRVRTIAAPRGYAPGPRTEHRGSDKGSLRHSAYVVTAN